MLHAPLPFANLLLGWVGCVGVWGEGGLVGRRVSGCVQLQLVGHVLLVHLAAQFQLHGCD